MVIVICDYTTAWALQWRLKFVLAWTVNAAETEHNRRKALEQRPQGVYAILRRTRSFSNLLDPKYLKSAANQHDLPSRTITVIVCRSVK